MKDRIKKFFLGLIGVRKEPRFTSNPLLEWPRNYLCICGSGKKFKYCCLHTLSTKVTIEDARKINLKLDKYRV